MSMFSSLLQPPCEVRLHLLNDVVFLQPPSNSQPLADESLPPSSQDQLLRGMVEILCPTPRRIAGIRVKLRGVQSIAILPDPKDASNPLIGYQPIGWEDGVITEKVVEIGIPPSQSSSSHHFQTNHTNSPSRSRSRHVSPARTPRRGMGGGGSGSSRPASPARVPSGGVVVVGGSSGGGGGGSSSNPANASTGSNGDTPPSYSPALPAATPPVGPDGADSPRGRPHEQQQQQHNPHHHSASHSALAGLGAAFARAMSRGRPQSRTNSRPGSTTTSRATSRAASPSRDRGAVAAASSGHATPTAAGGARLPTPREERVHETAPEVISLPPLAIACGQEGHAGAGVVGSGTASPVTERELGEVPADARASDGLAAPPRHEQVPAQSVSNAGTIQKQAAPAPRGRFGSAMRSPSVGGFFARSLSRGPTTTRSASTATLEPTTGAAAASEADGGGHAASMRQGRALYHAAGGAASSASPSASGRAGITATGGSSRAPSVDVLRGLGALRGGVRGRRDASASRQRRDVSLGRPGQGSLGVEQDGHQQLQQPPRAASVGVGEAEARGRRAHRELASSSLASGVRGSSLAAAAASAAAADGDISEEEWADVANRDQHGIDLAKGVHGFEFAFIIKADSPPYERSPLGRVRYILKATAYGAGRAKSNVESWREVFPFVNPSPDSGPTPLTVLYNDVHPTVGVLSIACTSSNVSVGGMFSVDVHSPTPPPELVVYLVRVSLETSVEVRTRRKGRQTVPPQKVKLFEKGWVPPRPKDPHGPGDGRRSDGLVRDPTRVGATPNDAWSVQGVARMPNDNVTRPTTVHGTKSSIRFSHNLVVEVVHSLDAHLADAERKLKVFALRQPIVLPSCCVAFEAVSLPAYSADDPMAAETTTTAIGSGTAAPTSRMPYNERTRRAGHGDQHDACMCGLSMRDLDERERSSIPVQPGYDVPIDSLRPHGKIGELPETSPLRGLPGGLARSLSRSSGRSARSSHSATRRGGSGGGVGGGSAGRRRNGSTSASPNRAAAPSGQGVGEGDARTAHAPPPGASAGAGGGAVGRGSTAAAGARRSLSSVRSGAPLGRRPSAASSSTAASSASASTRITDDEPASGGARGATATRRTSSRGGGGNGRGRGAAVDPAVPAAEGINGGAGERWAEDNVSLPPSYTSVTEESYDEEEGREEGGTPNDVGEGAGAYQGTATRFGTGGAAHGDGGVGVSLVDGPAAAPRGPPSVDEEGEQGEAEEEREERRGRTSARLADLVASTTAGGAAGAAANSAASPVASSAS